MGCDIVAIGTHHTLPVKDPVETVQRLAPIFDGVVSIGYYKRYEYNESENTVSECFEWVEIKEIKFNPDGWHYIFDICNEGARHLQRQIASLEDVIWVGEYTKSFFVDDLFADPFEIYKIEINKRRSFGLYIYQENVEFDVSFIGRWFAFEDIFKKPYRGENKKRLDDFRDYIYSQFKVAGCDKAYYFPDQGFGERLYNVINLPSDKWVDYMKSRGYIDDDDDTQFIFKMSDYINGRIMLSSDQNVICIIDDFADYK